MNSCELGSTLKQQAASANHRSGVVLAGEQGWGTATACELLAPYAGKAVLWIADCAPTGYRSARSCEVKRHLGTDLDVVVFDAHAGFNPDALGAIGGTIRGGGLLVLLTPALGDWPDFDDPEYQRICADGHNPVKPPGHYLRRVVLTIRHSPQIVVFEQGSIPSVPESTNHVTAVKFTHPSYGSADQQNAVEKIKHVVNGQRKRPLVLVSDRGRGKSASLGLAAGLLFEQGLDKIVVTGYNRRSVDQVFIHARRLFPAADRCLHFMPADQILQQQPEVDLLLVDEAAAIPLHLLQSLLTMYPRIVFASTVHGYEGTGRGFMLRFGEFLDGATRGWKKIWLQTPLRWAVDDPVERFLFDLLLLNAEPARIKSVAFDQGRCQVEAVSQSRLAADNSLLTDLFGLLVMAHYRTRPYDLRHILDGNNLAIYRLMQGRQNIGVVVVSHEGDFDETLTRQIWSGCRRPRGHLLPQILTMHLGLRDAARQKTARIMRIVIHPDFRQQGAGSFVLAWLSRRYCDQVDMIGASFGVSPDLLRFWSHAGYRTVRIGLNRSQYSGAHACLVLKGLTIQGLVTESRAGQNFSENFPLQLKTVLSRLDPRIVMLAYQSMQESSSLDQMNDLAFADLVVFGFGQRNLDTVLAALTRLAEYCLIHRQQQCLDEQQVRLLVEHILQGKDWHECTALEGHQGRADGIALMRQSIRDVLRHELPEKTRVVLDQSGLNALLL